jgi:hypothetical protein
MTKKNKKPDEFTSFYICDRLGIRKERFREWIDKEFIRPHKPAEGRGTKNLFKITDIYVIAIFIHLINCGFSRLDAATRTRGLLLEQQDPSTIRYIGFPRRPEGMEETFQDGKMVWPNAIIIGKKTTGLSKSMLTYIENFEDILFINFVRIKKNIDAKFG